MIAIRCFAQIDSIDKSRLANLFKIVVRIVYVQIILIRHKPSRANSCKTPFFSDIVLLHNINTLLQNR